MARFGEHEVWFEFTSDRFGHSSDLPPEANAGNRCYGRDVASFITAGLTERGLDAGFIDEDWGWQAHGKRPDESVREISIYHNLEGNQATEDDWALMLRSLRKERKLGISRFREIEVDADAVDPIRSRSPREPMAASRLRRPPSVRPRTPTAACRRCR